MTRLTVDGGPARCALATELHAEYSVLWTTGQVAEHKAILLSRALLARARRGRDTLPVPI